jgi:hypothetical protein
MAVFERLDLALVRDILAAAAGAGDELRAVTFENQVAGIGSIPDARITGHFTWWFETKTVLGAYATEGHGTRQLLEHAVLLEDDADGVLFILTPDPEQPAVVAEMSKKVGGRIVWVSFRQLAAAMEEISTRLFSEQTKFLLAELVQLFEVDGLLGADDTVVVAARWAWPEYHASGAYVCQPDRSFRSDVRYLGFYADGAIQMLVPRIRARHPSVPLSAEEAAARRSAGDALLADLIEQLLIAGNRVAGESYGILLLSGPDDAETVQLDQPVVNDTKTASGRTWAWTLSQRYTGVDKLRRVRFTSEL